MKRKLLLLSCSCYLLTALSAQITITNAYFPSAGDTLRTAVDALPSGIDMLSTGGENMWDFTDLAGVMQQQVAIRPASDGEFFNEFPNAELVTGSANQSTGELYYNVTNSAYEVMGYVGPDPANFGLNIVAKLQPFCYRATSTYELF